MDCNRALGRTLNFHSTQHVFEKFCDGRYLAGTTTLVEGAKHGNVLTHRFQNTCCIPPSTPPSQEVSTMKWLDKAGTSVLIAARFWVTIPYQHMFIYCTLRPAQEIQAVANLDIEVPANRTTLLKAVKTWKAGKWDELNRIIVGVRFGNTTFSHKVIVSTSGYVGIWLDSHCHCIPFLGKHPDFTLDRPSFVVRVAGAVHPGFRYHVATATIIGVARRGKGFGCG